MFHFSKWTTHIPRIFFSTTSGKLIVVISFFLILGAIVFGVHTMQGIKGGPVRFAVAEASTSGVLDVNVLAIGFNPTDASGSAADRYFSSQMGNRTAVEAEDYVFNSTIDAFHSLSNNSINYQIVHKTHITSFPEGQGFTMENYAQCVWGTPEFNPSFCDEKKYALDHSSWISSNQICELAQQYNADEVWMLSLPYVMTWESFMFGPRDTFNVNSPIALNAPQCAKNYVLMNGTYERLDEFMHIYGHRIESFMGYLTEGWSSSDKNTYWENFATISRYGNPTDPYVGVTCGNAHFPGNASQGYDYTNETIKLSSCSDWGNFPSLTGSTESINCTAWGCSSEGWQEYWFSSLPRSDGEALLTGGGGGQFSFKKNWWYYILFPENAIAQKKAQTNGTFSNLSSVFDLTDASFSFLYSGNTTQYIVDLSTLPDMSWDVYGGFGSGSQSPVTVSNPQARWDKYVCGATLYWKVYTSDRSIESPIQTATVSCPTPTPTVTPTPTSTPTPAPVTVTLNPVADAYVRSDKQNNNYGTAATMTTDNSPIYYSYLKYNLAPYAGKTLTNAVFKVRVGADASSGTQSIYGMSDSSWTETGVKYSNRPSLGSNLVGTFVGNTTNTWKNVTATSYLSSRMGQLASFGISSSNSDSMNISSREASSSNRPQLVITYQ